MTRSIASVVRGMKPFLKKSKTSNCDAESKTSLFTLLFNGGCLMFSDSLATAGSLKFAKRQKKIYQIGDDSILLAGTGSIGDTFLTTRNTDLLIQYWKSENDLEPIPPEVASELIWEAADSGDQAWFLMAGYNHQTDQGYIGEIFSNGVTWQSGLYQINGSGTDSMLAPAEKLSDKVLGKEPLTTEDVYEKISQTKFSKELAMLEGLNIIESGTACDTGSGGNAFQLMVVEKSGVSEYVLSKEVAAEILDFRGTAQHSYLNPEMATKEFDHEKCYKLFEIGRRK